MMASREEIYQAILNADKAGDGASVRALGDYLKAMPVEHATPAYDKTAFDNGPLKVGKEGFGDALRSTLQDTDWGTRNIAAAGTALSGLYQGAKQFVGMGDEQQIEANKIMQQEAPVGAIAGNVAATAIPFGLAGNSVKAAGAIGAGFGALQPVEGDQSFVNIAQGKAINTALGGATAAGGQVLANKVTSAVSNKIADLSKRASQDGVLNDTLKEVNKVGYVIPPSYAPTSGSTSRVLEGISGKYKTNQLAGIKNQRVTNDLARQSLGMSDRAPISLENIEKVRNAAYAPYREIVALQKKEPVKAASAFTDWGTPTQAQSGFNPAQALEQLKQARSDATSWFKAYNHTPNPEWLAKAKAYRDAADSIESGIENYATSLGKADLVQRLVDARKMIAKTYVVERALKPGSGNVNAKVIARLYNKQSPLSDGLDTIGKFASTFEDVAGIPKSGNANPITALDFQTGTPAAMAGMFLGGPLGALAGVAPAAVRVASRYGMLSGPAQKALIRPDYAIGLPTRAAAGLFSNAPVGSTVLGLDALGQ